jgi:hypothetical protein
MDYLKIGKASELTGKDRGIYRCLEKLPAFLSLGTLAILIIGSFIVPVWVAYFIIAFDVYWLLLVVFLAIYLLVGYKKLRINHNIDWRQKCFDLTKDSEDKVFDYKKFDSNYNLSSQGLKWTDIYQLILLPTYNESLEILHSAFLGLTSSMYPTDKMIVVLAIEGRAGQEALDRAAVIEKEFSDRFFRFLITVHPDGIEGELKGKGANQAWAAKEFKAKIVDKENIPYEKILVSVFDIDTIAAPGYFHRLAYAFLTVTNPYRASYQPVPLYHNNVFSAPFFARVASSSNTFWQIMQQIRPEKLATYSSHSMTFLALSEIGFWSTTMVSEDSRVFFHCLFYYNGDYRVEPLHFPVYMDTTMDKSAWQTAKSLYKQQRRWAWGAENVPYLIFNTKKRWSDISNKYSLLRIIGVQIYGFHSWATNALIIAVIGWMPILFGGSKFSNTVLSGNLPEVTSLLMNLSLVGLFVSAAVSSVLLPKFPKEYNIGRRALFVLEWIFVPVSVIIFGSIPCLDAQIHLMRGKYLGFWVTPKAR